MSLCAFAERHPTESCSDPLWSAALLPEPEPNLAQRYWEGRDQAGITYLDDGRLVVHQVYTDPGQLASRQSPDISSPFRLQAWLVDDDNGKPLLRREWGTRSTGSAIMANRDGIIVRTGETLRLLSNDFVELQKVQLPSRDPSDADAMEDSELQVSPSRQSLLFNHYRASWENASFSRFDVLDGDNLKVKQEWKEIPAMYHTSASVSDNAIAYVAHVHRRDRIFISEFGVEEWKPLWVRSGEACYSSNVFALLADNSFVYACKEFSFVSGGKALMRDKFAKGELPVNGKVSIADNGRFIAISLSRIKIDPDPKERLAALSVVVYDLLLKKRIQTVEISPLPTHYHDFAVSPDGSRLAILNDQTVSVCELPREGPEMQRADSGEPAAMSAIR